MNRSTLIHSLAVLGLATAASAGTMYAVDSNRTLYTIDLATGAKTMVGTVASAAGTVGALARDHANGITYLSSTSLDKLFTVDLGTGAVTEIGSYGNPAVIMHGLEYDSSTGQLYGSSDGDLWTIDKTTGVAASVADSGVGAFVNLGYVSTTDTLYALSGASDSTYTVNRMTGAFTLLGPLGGGVTAPHALAFNTEDGVLYMLDQTLDNLYRIDQVTGAATLIGSTGAANLLGMVFVPDPLSAVPYCFGDGSGTACPCTPVPLVGDADKGCPNSFNAGGGKLTASGLASIANDTLVMTCTTINNGGAVIFQGTNDNGGGLGTAFGDGLRCAAGTVRRMRSHAVTTNTHQYPDPMFGDNAISIRGAVLAPGDRWYQGWYRSGLAHCNPAENYNLTNGVKVTWLP